MHLLRAARRPATARWTAAHSTARHRRGQGVLDQARLPDLRHQLPRARPAHVLATTASTAGAPSCVGTGLALTREQRKALRRLGARRRQQAAASRASRREEAEVEGVADAPCPDCDGARLNPASRGVTFDGAADQRAWRACRCSDARRWVEALRARRPRRRHRARRRHRDPRAGSSSSSRSAWAT